MDQNEVNRTDDDEGKSSNASEGVKSSKLGSKYLQLTKHSLPNILFAEINVENFELPPALFFPGKDTPRFMTPGRRPAAAALFVLVFPTLPLPALPMLRRLLELAPKPAASLPTTSSSGVIKVGDALPRLSRV